MLRAIIDVNGRKIALMHIVQIKTLDGDLRKYRYKVTQWPDAGDSLLGIISFNEGEIEHHRRDGALELIRKVIDDIKKRRNDND